MKRLGLAAIGVLLLALCVWMARAAVVSRSPATQPSQHLDLPAAQGALRFVPVDILLDTGARPLGAYQVEITAKNADIVGLEGGDPAPFQKAPYYDPAALQGGADSGRIIVAAFSTDAALPTGATRVARLHLAVRGAGEGADKPDLTSRLVVATDGAGQAIQTKLELRVSPEGDRK
jgi:hypothetical protein